MGAATLILLVLVLLVLVFVVTAAVWPRADRPKWMTRIVDATCANLCKKYTGEIDATIYTAGGEFPAGHVFEEGSEASHVVS